MLVESCFVCGIPSLYLLCDHYISCAVYIIPYVPLLRPLYLFSCAYRTFCTSFANTIPLLLCVSHLLYLFCDHCTFFAVCILPSLRLLRPLLYILYLFCCVCHTFCTFFAAMKRDRIGEKPIGCTCDNQSNSSNIDAMLPRAGGRHVYWSEQSISQWKQIIYTNQSTNQSNNVNQSNQMYQPIK